MRRTGTELAFPPVAGAARGCSGATRRRLPPFSPGAVSRNSWWHLSARTVRNAVTVVGAQPPARVDRLRPQRCSVADRLRPQCAACRVRERFLLDSPRAGAESGSLFGRSGRRESRSTAPASLFSRTGRSGLTQMRNRNLILFRPSPAVRTPALEQHAHDRTVYHHRRPDPRCACPARGRRSIGWRRIGAS